MAKKYIDRASANGKGEIKTMAKIIEIVILGVIAATQIIRIVQNSIQLSCLHEDWETRKSLMWSQMKLIKKAEAEMEQEVEE